MGTRVWDARHNAPGALPTPRWCCSELPPGLSRWSAQPSTFTPNSTRILLSSPLSKAHAYGMPSVNEWFDVGYGAGITESSLKLPGLSAVTSPLFSTLNVTALDEPGFTFTVALLPLHVTVISSGPGL